MWGPPQGSEVMFRDTVGCNVRLKKRWLPKYVDNEGNIVEGRMVRDRQGRERRIQTVYDATVEQCQAREGAENPSIPGLVERFLDASYECIANGDLGSYRYATDRLEQIIEENVPGTQDDGYMAGPTTTFVEGPFVSVDYCDGSNAIMTAFRALQPYIVGGYYFHPNDDCEESEYCSILGHTFFLRDGTAVYLTLDWTT